MQSVSTPGEDGVQAEDEGSGETGGGYNIYGHRTNEKGITTLYGNTLTKL